MSRPLRILMTADAVGGVWTYCMELAAAVENADVEVLLATMGPFPSPAQRAEAARFAHVQLATGDYKLEWMDDPWSAVDAAGDWLLELAEEFRPDVVHLNGYVHADLPWGGASSLNDTVAEPSGPGTVRRPADLPRAAAAPEGQERLAGGGARYERNPRTTITDGGAPEGRENGGSTSLPAAPGFQTCPVLVVAHSCVLSWWSAVKGEFAPPRLAEYGRRVGRGLRHADRIVAPTSAMLDMLREHYAFDTAARVIPNGRRPSLFTPGEKQPFIFSAGRLWDEAKNVALLERIAPGLSWPVRLAGQTAGLSPTSKPCAIFLGELTPPALAQELADAAIYAAPARYEPFGLGILEAALAGCALVLSDIPSLRENWTGAAVFVSPNDEAAWRDELNRLTQDTSRRLELATAARERALQLTPTATANAYLATWRELAIAEAPLAPRRRGHRTDGAVPSRRTARSAEPCELAASHALSPLEECLS